MGAPPHVWVGAIQVVAQSVAVGLLSMGYTQGAFFAEIVGGASSSLAAYLTQQGA